MAKYKEQNNDKNYIALLRNALDFQDINTSLILTHFQFVLYTPMIMQLNIEVQIMFQHNMMMHNQVPL